MRKISLSFLHCYLVAILLNIYSLNTNAQVPVFETVTFGTEKTLPDGWTVKDSGTLNNTWEIINSVWPSSGYVNASGDSHIKIDASASSTDYLYSPVIDCSSFTNGTLKIGIWRSDSYDESLYICFDLDNDNSFTEKKYAIPYTILPAETWTIYEIDLGHIIDHNPKVRIRFNQSGINRNSGPLRIDDIILYGSTHYFRSQASGDWNNPAIWESSINNADWISATAAPTYQANTITVCNSHTVTSTSPLSVDQLTITKGGTLSLTQDLELNDGTGADLTVEEGGILDLSTFSIKTAGTIQLNGHLKTANPNGLTGSLSTGIEPIFGLNSLVEYNAVGNQYVSPLPYVNLLINSSGEKILTGTTTLSKDLQVNGGFLVLGDHNLIVGNTVSGSSSSYVKVNGTGQLTIHNIGADSKTFPIGNSTYNPVTITNGGGLNWTVGVRDDWAISDPGLDYFRDKAVHRIWSITPSTNLPSAAADITLEYNDSDPLQVGSKFDRFAPVWAWYQTDEDWLPAEATPPNRTAYGTQKVGVSVNIRSSQLTISNTDTPLPIRFRDVRVEQKQGSAFIYFTNETEEGIENYTLERSGNGPLYNPVRVIMPKRNDGSAASYEVEDSEPLEGLTLYRVRANERTGEIVYSPVVRLNSKEHTPHITLAPNPASAGTVLLQFSNLPRGNYRLMIYNSHGQKVLQQDLYHAGGSSGYPLLTWSLQPGTYFLELTGKEKLLQRLVIL